MTDVDCEPPESIPADTEEKWPPAFTPSMADAATSMAGAPSMLLLQSQVLREQYTQLRENEERDRLQQQAELERIMCQEEPIVANQNLAGDTQLQLLEEVKKLKQEITAELAAVSRKKRREDKEKKKEKKEKKEKKKEKKEKEVANADEEMSPSKAKKKKKKKEPWELDSDEEHQNGLSVILPEGRKGKPFNLAEELAQIVGLDSVKTAIRSISTTIRAHQRRVERGLTKATNNKMMCHMLFLGNPGTGKTTMARVVARLLKDIGLLAKGHLVEASAKDLIAGHCGQTALKTAAVCKKALGGVLFIDEAYGINPKGDSNFGQECVDTLVKEMEDHFHELVVIMAGYPQSMERFLECNEGLRSRFNSKFVFTFENYTVPQLAEIFMKEVAKQDYLLEEGLEEKLPLLIEQRTTEEERSKHNGRLIRSLVANCVAKQNERWVEEEEVDDATMITILEEDIVAADCA